MPKDAETLPAPEAKRIDALERNNQELRSQVDELKRKVELLLGRKVDTELTDEQNEIFSRLETVIGNDATAQRQAERVLREFEGMRVLKALVVRLQTYLKGQSLGIKTDQGHAAAPVWQPDLGSPGGGYMRYSHFDPARQGSVKTESHSKFPVMKLVPRPDGRRTRHL